MFITIINESKVINNHALQQIEATVNFTFSGANYLAFLSQKLELAMKFKADYYKNTNVHEFEKRVVRIFKTKPTTRIAINFTTNFIFLTSCPRYQHIPINFFSSNPANSEMKIIFYRRIVASTYPVF